MKYRIIIAALFFVIPGLSYLNADIYRWTDSKGNVVYGNLPPSDASNVKLMFRETPGSPGTPPPPAQKRNAKSRPAGMPSPKNRVRR
jgi:hypothetical protein